MVGGAHNPLFGWYTEGQCDPGRIKAVALQADTLKTDMTPKIMTKM